MKIRCAVLFIICCVLTACDRRDVSATGTASDSATAQAWKDYNERVRQQREDYARQAKSTEEQLQAHAEMQKRADARLQAQEELHKRAEALMTTQEQMTKRQQDDFVRFEKILDTWET